MMTPEQIGFPMEVQFPYPRPETSKSKIRDFARNRRPTKSCRLLLGRPAVEDCFCLDHGPSPEVSYMRYIRSKDGKLYNQLQSIRGAMSRRSGEILDHLCPDMDAKMNAFHMVDYMKRGCYSPLGPVKTCQTGTPIEPLRIGLTNGYRDPELFPFQPKNRRVVDKPCPLLTTQAPVYLKEWFSSYFPRRTEYEETISQFGLVRMRNTRQYLEPQPSSRLRAGDPNY